MAKVAVICGYDAHLGSDGAAAGWAAAAMPWGGSAAHGAAAEGAVAAEAGAGAANRVSKAARRVYMKKRGSLSSNAMESRRTRMGQRSLPLEESMQSLLRR